MSKNETTKENCINFLKEVYSFLAMDFKSQVDSRGSLGDILTEDIAEDCDYNHLCYFISILAKYYKESVVDNIRVNAVQISETFSIKQNESEFWTLLSLENSEEWGVQRRRANAIVDMLTKL